MTDKPAKIFLGSCLTAFLILAGLKLTGTVAWSWWLIAAPLLFWVSAMVLIAVIAITFYEPNTRDKE